MMKLHLHPPTIITLYIFISILAFIFIISFIQPLQTLGVVPFSSSSSSSQLTTWSNYKCQTHNTINITSNTTSTTTSSTSINYPPRQDEDLNILVSKLQDSVTFLPLKDLRYSSTPQRGHTWFISSLYDTHEEGEVQYQRFPSHNSQGRLLCVKGRDSHDGSWNSYGQAWPQALPHNATLYKGLTFMSYNHYNYDNIWHGISAMFPFVAWHLKNGCKTPPSRWVLYHWGELRTKIRSPWLISLTEATFGVPVYIEDFDEIKDNNPVCFEDVVVMRHNEGGMSRKRRIEAYDLLRCKAGEYCKVKRDDRGKIGMTMLLRTGARSFMNDSAVIEIFQKECMNVEGCSLQVAYASNLTVCQQVKLMSSTDILVSPHGAQLTNLFLMDKNSSVMEFFPKGWLKLAGVGQHVFKWLASWSDMIHQGTYRDTDTDHRYHCPFPEDDRRCMSVYKNAQIGLNQTYFSEWAKGVLQEVKLMKTAQEKALPNTFSGCTC